MATAQALDFRRFTPNKGTQKAREVIRIHKEHLCVDSPLYNDHNSMKKLVKSGEVLEERQKMVDTVGLICVLWVVYQSPKHMRWLPLHGIRFIHHLSYLQ